jgi:5-(carboxyamino)imidazole ribonucleotide mutase
MKMANQTAPLIGILMGSDSDLSIMEEAFQVLDDFNVPYEVRILSAHRSPDQTAEYSRNAAARGLRVLIAGAGWAAHLAGVIAAATTLPVIGVPIASSPLNGLDALFSTVQMPPGVPVATMPIGKGGAKNAALFAIQILALEQSELAVRFREYKEKMATESVIEKGAKLDQYLQARRNPK